MKRFSLSMVLFALTIFVGATPAKSVIIDFSTFNVGDGLAQVNAVSMPLGATFSSSTAGPFEIVDLGGTNVARAQTLPAEADILVNFNAAFNFVSVDFADNPDGNFLVVLQVFSAPQVLVINPAEIIGGQNSTDPATLSLSVPGILATRFESGSGFIYIKSVEFDNQQQTIAEPGILSLFCLGLAGLGLARCRKAA